MRIVFFGTSSFAAKVLKYLLANDAGVVAVVTRPDKPQGRSSKLTAPPVKDVAGNLPVYQPIKASTDDFASQLKDIRPDLFVVVAYGEIIKKNILDIPSKGCINVHASLLPKYRGAAPMQRCLMQGEKETGVTIMEMDVGLDSGPILEVATIDVPLEMTFGELEMKMFDQSCPALLRVIHALEIGSIEKKPQDHSLATYAAKITPVDEEIHWDKTAEEIHNQIRALSPKPGAFCTITINGEKKRLKILRTYPTEEGFSVPGKTGFLQLLDVQLEGKNPMKAEDFLRGLQGKSLIFVKDGEG